MIELTTTDQYRCRANLDLYSFPVCEGLATQAAKHRQLRIESLTPTEQAIRVRLCEDDYPAWLQLTDIEQLELAPDTYQAIEVERDVIAARIPEVIAFAQSAMSTQNRYLWGGTVAPDKNRKL